MAPDKFRENTLAFDIVVAEGKYARYHIFPTLPDPVKNEWAGQAAAKLLSTLGVEQNPGETVIEAFNRAASNGHAIFTGETKQFTTGAGKIKPDMQWFSVAPYTGSALGA